MKTSQKTTNKNKFIVSVVCSVLRCVLYNNFLCVCGIAPVLACFVEKNLYVTVHLTFVVVFAGGPTEVSERLYREASIRSAQKNWINVQVQHLRDSQYTFQPMVNHSGTQAGSSSNQNREGTVDTDCVLLIKFFVFCILLVQRDCIH